MSECIDFENNEDGEAKWLEARKKYISATQTYFAICNFCEDDKTKNKYISALDDKYKQSMYSFYWQKHFTQKQQEKYDKLFKIKKPKAYQSQEFGKKYECDVATGGMSKLRQMEEFVNAKLTPNGRRIYYLDDCSATPDYIITLPNKEQVLLECKTSKPLNDEEKRKVISRYSLQVNTQMLCTGIKRAYIAFATKDKKGEKIVDIENIPVKCGEKLQQQILIASKKCREWLDNCNANELKPDISNVDDMMVAYVVNNVAVC